MQQYNRLPRNLLKLNRFIAPEENLSEEAKAVKQKLAHCKLLMRSKVPWKTIQQVVGISRASYYRISKRVSLLGLKGFVRRSKRPRKLRESKIPKHVIQLVLRLRRENPTYGKSKIVVLLHRDHAVQISESSVGRILHRLMQEGKVVPYKKTRHAKKTRNFKSHAKRWRYGMKGKEPGELVQIDHMSVSHNQASFKHFQAWDPITKSIVAHVTSNAKSVSAAKFLRKVIKEFPFAVKSIQVDGGSEFMKDFEGECKKLNIPLFVLPPRRPQFNGGVERGNRTFREEFYANPNLTADSVRAIEYELQLAVKKYNTYRPHFNLNGCTPYDYYIKLSRAA